MSDSIGFNDNVKSLMTDGNNTQILTRGKVFEILDGYHGEGGWGGEGVGGVSFKL